MKFYFRGLIWDKDSQKVLCESENGIYETEEQPIIDKLIAMGISTEGKEKKIDKGMKMINIKTGEEIIPGVSKEVAVEVKKELKKEIAEQQTGKKKK